ncbi:hypothetical protein FQN55_004897 [Onygenales sp. PD_40]|nr:hypothetical protein FQN55_004897 [Onygenales sp. PD_40]
MHFTGFSILLLLQLLFQPTFADVVKEGSTCTVTPLGGDQDDSVQVVDAFLQCGQDGIINFETGTYSIQRVMDIRDISNCEVNIYGTFIWSTDIQYWLSNSISVEYSGRSTAWRLGGDNFTIRGHYQALFDGNGQLWYDQNKNQGNQNGRPISFTLWEARNVLVDGIKWIQPQFWHTFIAYSDNITMTNLDMNATSNSQWSTVNTDGTNTWNSNNVRISNWTVTSGDDSISAKGNSTNIHVSDITCYESGAMVIGSIGNNAIDYVENVLFENIRLNHSSNAAWIKTYPANGGYVKNITFRNIEFSDVNQPIYISPCIYSGQNCDGSRLPISDITWENIRGTARYNVGAGIHCSASAPGQNLRFVDFDITTLDEGEVEYLCSNIANQADSGLPCSRSCPGNWPQELDGPA